MPRYFTLRQAEGLLPVIDSIIREAIQKKADWQDAGQRVTAAMQRIMMQGGTIPDQSAVAADRARRDESATRLKELIEQIHETGCQIKDLDIGLVDFPCLFRGREVLLCWKLGETGIAFWHDTEEGFRGRKPIDDVFLREHRGEPAN